MTPMNSYLKNCFIKNIQNNQRKPIHKQMTLMNTYFLNESKHTEQPAQSNSKANESYELIFLSKSKNIQHNQHSPIRKQMTLMNSYF